ncbi:MAG: hypothetical protein CVV32_04575 [Methanomicrobiales archaeon HGW-Methanomicrobiales-3]|jgi:hypothetical protein|nr:MAG: hypothetical protein CVV32_04575 [Methanomicrobiales archaeon HGW-Methanomicrobiales-3]
MHPIDETNFTIKDFFFTFDGIGFSVSIPIFPDVKNLLSIENPESLHELSQYYLGFIQNSIQKKYLTCLLEEIRNVAKSQDDLARIAISLVQHIPYDYEKADSLERYHSSRRIRYPYEVISDNRGICSEKSLLLAFLLKESGFGVVLFDFNDENHMALGIQCPEECSLYGCGYGFVETTVPSIVTDIKGDYISSTALGIFRSKLKTYPKVIPLGNGHSFEEIYVEYFDAKEWNDIKEKHPFDEGFFFQQQIKIMQKYGL